MDLQQILDQTVELARAAGKMAQQARSELKTQKKPDGSLVTVADREVETMLRRELTKLVPGTTVWGEEEGFENPGPNGIWLVDPVDGTSNFAFGSHFWGVSIALATGNELILGVIALPDLGEVYAGAKGLGATVNGKPLAKLKSGPINAHELVSYCDDSVELFGKKNLPGKMRYMGAWVVEAALVFDGVYRGAISHKAGLYDVAASVVIARELSGEVRYIDGSPFEIEPLLGKPGLGKPLLLFPAETGFTLQVNRS